jgi:hypothetical protein
MKPILKTLLILSLLNPGCTNKPLPNHFLSSSDTLLIRTEKQEGDGLFTLGAVRMDFKDTTKEFANSVIFPKQITNIKRIQLSTDFWAKEPHQVDIMYGKIAEKEIFIVDENNNQNFTDDSVRIFKPVKWRTTDGLIKCKYLISNGQRIAEDSTWIRIGILHDNFYCGRSEHLVADFTIDNKGFKVGIIDYRAGCFIYGFYPEIAILSQNSEKKDTLYEKDILKRGEFLNLNGNYYRFENITNNGEFITLIKEKNFDKVVGVQVGMIAPEFICKTVAGDTLRSSALHERIIIIANTCGCGGDEETTQAYYDIKKEYGDNIHIFRLDSKIEKSVEGLQIDVAEKFNRDIYDKYRAEYCSRICYVIDKNNRIIDRFPSEDWKSNLPELMTQIKGPNDKR